MAAPEQVVEMATTGMGSKSRLTMHAMMLEEMKGYD